MSLVVLTTIFTYTKDYTPTSWLYQVNIESTFYFLHGKPLEPTCLPKNQLPNDNQFYEPGVCPSGYTTACQGPASSGNPNEVHGTCCP